MSRAWSLALPVVTVLVVTYALLVAGVPRKVVGARIYGGPTEGTAKLSLRVESVRREGESEAPFWNGPLSVQAHAVGTAPVAITALHGVSGVVDVELPFARPVHGPVNVEIRDASGSLLAGGELSLDATRWALRARRRGGWIRGRADGVFVVSVAPERGAFVVGSADPLLIRVERSGDPAPGVALTISAEGARLNGVAGLHTDARGRARVMFEPSELNPTLRVEAHGGDAQSGLIDTGVPVVPGGFHGTATATGVRVESAVPRSEAFFSVVSDRGRVLGGVLALASNGHGGSLATVELPALPHPVWLVVSSDVDQNSAATIGWPLDVGPEPAQTFDVPDVLLLDGLPAAFQREQERRSRVRWLSASFIAVAFALSVALLVLRVRAADRDISQHLREGLEAEVAARVAPRRALSLLVALLTLGLGFIALGLIVAAR